MPPISWSRRWNGPTAGCWTHHNAVLQSQFPHPARQYEEVGLAVQQEQAEEQSGYNSDPGLRNNPVTQSVTDV